ncbi:MAG: bile acid:sodium symporter [Planctomycetes bacterium]|nr:bile acid:sodium symporter [Planctomycetota bacterium]
MLPWIGRNWFLIAFTGALAAAAYAPAPGAAGGAFALDQAKPWLITGIFLIAGLTLPTRQLGVALGSVRAHVFVQGFAFLMVPCLMLGLDPVLAAAGLAPELRQGLLVMACLPTTIATCVAQTRAGGGDEAMALCESALGNLLGVFVTPVLVLLCTGRDAAVPVLEVLRTLGLTVILPLIVGQLISLPCARALSAKRRWFGTATSLLLVALIYHIFCNSFARGWNVPRSHLFAVGTVVAVLHAVLLVGALALSAAPVFAFGRRQRVAATICASQKTAALGVPLLTILYHGDPALPLLSAPLLMYHFLQLLVATALTPLWRQWADGPVSPPAAGSRVGD